MKDCSKKMCGHGMSVNQRNEYCSFHIIWDFLAHLSRRLIGELIVYPWSLVRWRLSTMLKHLLRNRLADQSQILCGASLGRGNEILFAASGSHDQDGRHAHIVKTLKKSSPEPAVGFPRNLVCSIGESSPS